MTANDEAEQIERLKHRAAGFGYRLIPIAETNLFQLVFRISTLRVGDFRVDVIVTDKLTNSPVEAQIVDGPRQL